MRIHEFPDQSQALEPDSPVYFTHLANKHRISFGLLLGILRQGDVPVRYDILTLAGNLTHRLPGSIVPATPANTAYLAGECRRAYDRSAARYRVASIYEPTPTQLP